MALPAHSAFASLDAGHLCKRSNFPSLQSLLGKHREGFVALQPARSCVHVVAEGSSPTAVAVPPKLDGDKCQEMRFQMKQEEIDARPFTIRELKTGGEQDWHPSTVTTVEDAAPGIRKIIVETECSREMVSLENAYTANGQLAQVKVNGGEIVKVAVACPPFSLKMNDPVLYKMRGDIPAGQTKQPQYFLSVLAPLELLAFQAETPMLFNLKAGDEVEIGPFDQSGLDLRPILFLARFPTILLFASGKGISVAKAIVETKDADIASLSLGMREEIRLFYWSSEPSLVLYKDLFEKWENTKLKVRTAVARTSGKEWSGHVGSFTSLWDEDDIEYDPDMTAVIVCVDRDSRNEVGQLLADAGISEKQIIRWEI